MRGCIGFVCFPEAAGTHAWHFQMSIVISKTHVLYDVIGRAQKFQNYNAKKLRSGFSVTMSLLLNLT